MNSGSKHPDVVPYAQGDLIALYRPDIERHLAECAECRDLVVFIRKTNTTLQYEGRVYRVAKALGISVEQLNQEMRQGTSIAALVDRPPEAPVGLPTQPVQPVSPTKK